MARSNSTKRLALLSLFCALGAVILYFGSFIEVLDMSVAVLASLLTVATVIEYGSSSAWLVYAATSAVSLIILPKKLPAIMYVAFFGFYPIIKQKLEKRLRRGVCWLVKLAIFNAAIILWIAATKWLLLGEASPFALEVVVFVLANAAMLLYDIALTRAVSFYIFKVRKRFKLDK